MDRMPKDHEIFKDAILEGIRKVKGYDIRIIDLSTINYSECGYFFICHGTSTTQVNAIAQSVEKSVKDQTGEDARHTEGYRNALWILLDYGDTVVHIFHKETRKYYDLEGLWSDASFTDEDFEN